VPLDLPMVTPIQIARACYLKWKSNPSFYEDLEDYLEHGIVIARPDIFAMAKIIEAGESQALFVRIAVGKLRTLLSALPVLPAAICFCRRNESRLRVYSLARLLQVTDKLIKRKT
jgi:hypothetical protein